MTVVKPNGAYKGGTRKSGGHMIARSPGRQDREQVSPRFVVPRQVDGLRLVGLK